jgi:hypothetical protein
VLAVDYDHYIILQHRTFISPEGRYVGLSILNVCQSEIYYALWQIPEKWLPSHGTRWLLIGRKRVYLKTFPKTVEKFSLE